MKSCALTFHTHGILNAVKNVVCRKARRAGWRSLAVRSSSYVHLSESAKTLHYIFRSRSRRPSPQGRDARTPLSVVCPGSAALVRSTQLAVAVTWHCVTAVAAAEGRAAEQQTELPNNVNRPGCQLYSEIRSALRINWAEIYDLNGYLKKFYATSWRRSIPDSVLGTIDPDSRNSILSVRVKLHINIDVLTQKLAPFVET